jgi:hypothetical protein
MSLVYQNITYQHAVKHSIENTRCAHFGCSLIVNDKLFHVTTNRKGCHAEMSALSALWTTCSGRPPGQYSQ